MDEEQEHQVIMMESKDTETCLIVGIPTATGPTNANYTKTYEMTVISVVDHLQSLTLHFQVNVCSPFSIPRLNHFFNYPDTKSCYGFVLNTGDSMQLFTFGRRSKPRRNVTNIPKEAADVSSSRPAWWTTTFELDQEPDMNSTTDSTHLQVRTPLPTLLDDIQKNDN